MSADPHIPPNGFPNWCGVWETVCAHVPQTAFFLCQQYAHTFEGTDAAVNIYKRTVLLSVLPELLKAAEIAGSQSEFINHLSSIEIHISSAPVDIYDVCQLLQSIDHVDTTIPRQEKPNELAIHVTQLRLRERGSFLLPSLSIVLQFIRLLLSNEKMPPLSVELLEENKNRPVDFPGDVKDCLGATGERWVRAFFALSGESSKYGCAAMLLAIAACSSSPEGVPSDLKLWLSALPVCLRSSSKAGDALVGVKPLPQHYR